MVAMVELVDTPDCGSGAEMCESSSLSGHPHIYKNILPS